MTERDPTMTTPDAPLTPTPAAPGGTIAPTASASPVTPVPPTAASSGPATPSPSGPVTPAPATPVQPVTPVRRPTGGRWVNVLLGLAAVVAIGGVAFAIGRSTAPTDSAVAFPDGGIVIDGSTGSFDPGAGPQVRPGGPGLLGTGPTLEGTVTAVDPDSITIRLANGDEISIALDDETTYHEATVADASTVAVGDDVAVRAEGGRITIGQGDQGQLSPDLTADDVTVRR
jgi:hypothetical protein